jgi:hypothetical protein
MSLCLALLGCAALPAAAQDAPPWTIGDIKFSGLVDGYYQWANNHPASGLTTLRNFEVGANTFNLNMVELSAVHDPAPVGFRLDLGWGRAWDIFNSFDNPRTSSFTRFIQQAYVSVKPEDWGGFQFDFGRFYTSAGAELTENNYTWTYGRGFVYTNGPYYHMGARMTKPLSDNFTVGVQLVNGWNNMLDNNSGKTVGITTALTGEKASWFNTYYFGPEKTGTNDGFRHFYDTVLNLTPNDKLSAYINFDYGHEKNYFGPASDVSWWVLGSAVHYTANDHNSFTFRYEYYDDMDGWLLLGSPVALQSYTGTYEYKWAQGLAARLEWRTDTADQPVYAKGAGFSKNQSTITLGFIAYFGGN